MNGDERLYAARFVARLAVTAAGKSRVPAIVREKLEGAISALGRDAQIILPDAIAEVQKISARQQRDSAIFALESFRAPRKPSSKRSP